MATSEAGIRRWVASEHPPALRCAWMGASPCCSWKPLDACGEATRARLQGMARPVQFAPGELIITAGLPPEGVVLLIEGVVRVFHASRDSGRQFTVKLLRAPDAVGLVEVLRGSTWIASVEALTPLSAVQFPAAAIQEALWLEPGFAAALLEDITTKFEGTIRNYRAMGFEDCDTRVIRVLLEYAAQFGREDGGSVVVRYPLPRERLAREIGAARRSVDRALTKLTREGLVELSPKGWQVLRQPDTLRARLERD